ncbi:hypothetical protein SSX86_027406 [Deinandra increscens subsp. villosa]|uniref:AB hydrolase-1 domain-containing protein n=1 Tax=Deinandra increscens subsp. villosa TaxID=3103831 RepID=A0AAP0CHX1_9ASTR
MDKIKHNYVQVNGLKLHVAEIGAASSPAVVFLHGFPEIWYTWRHQMVAVANAGFRAIAPDYRGYGLSDIPAEPDKTLLVDLVHDTASILDALGISKVFVIGKDFGAMVAYIFSVIYREKVTSIVTFGLPFMPPASFHQSCQAAPEGFYFRRWEEPGRAEADFGRFDAKTVVRKIYIMFSSSEIQIASENQEIMDLVDPSTPLPSWFTEDDLAVYGDLYQKSGFQTPLQVPYRSFTEKIGPPQQGPDDLKVEAPTLLIMGKKDYMFKFPGMEEYLKSEQIKKYVPNLEIVYLAEGCHFVVEQFPEEVNNLILNYLNHNKY